MISLSPEPAPRDQPDRRLRLQRCRRQETWVRAATPPQSSWRNCESNNSETSNYSYKCNNKAKTDNGCIIVIAVFVAIPSRAILVIMDREVKQ